MNFPRFIIQKESHIRTICLFIFMIIFTGCTLFHPNPQLNTVPIVYFDFNQNLKNEGIQNYQVLGSNKLCYSKGIKDSCLNLSITSQYRHPLIVKTKNDIVFNHQSYLAVIVWVKIPQNDFDIYGIIGNKSIVDKKGRGWIITTTKEGSWKLEISDGYKNREISGYPENQNLCDNQWHQIGFLLDKNSQTIRTYFDGVNKGIMSLKNLQDFESDAHLHIGCTPGAIDYSKETFNGFIDEIGIWTKSMDDRDFAKNFRFIKKEIAPCDEYASNDFKIATWNIWNGGQQRGKVAGVKQTANIIKKADIDIISIQEDFGSGEVIADLLNYHYFKVSDNLSVISRFPIEETYHIYKPLNSGGANIKINKNKTILFCPVWLNYKPNIRGLLMNKEAHMDSIINTEENSRANEMKFIISEVKKFRYDNSDKPIYLAGNFNCGSHLDWTPKNMENKYGKVIPFPTTLILSGNGFTDAYRKIWPDESENQGNTYSPIFKEGYQDRLDYIFYSDKDIKPIDAQIIDTSDSFFPSDHGLLVVTFKMN